MQDVHTIPFRPGVRFTLPAKPPAPATRTYVLDLTKMLEDTSALLTGVAVLIDPSLTGGNVSHSSKSATFSIGGGTAAQSPAIAVQLSFDNGDVEELSFAQPIVALDPAIPAGAITLGGVVVTLLLSPVDLTGLAALPGGAQTGDKLLAMRGSTLGYLPPGAGGGSISLGEFTFTQAIPSATWTINHNLGRHPEVVVLTSAGDRVFGDVHYSSAAQCVLSFGGAFAGTAFLT